MQHFNNFVCEASIVKQHGVKNLPNGNHLCSFNVVHESINEEKLWMNCSMFTTEKQADFLSGLKPGRRIYLTGKLKLDKYNDKQTFKLEVYNFSLPPLPPLKNGETNGNTSQNTSGDISNNNIDETIIPDAPETTEDIPF